MRDRDSPYCLCSCVLSMYSSGTAVVVDDEIVEEMVAVSPCAWLTINRGRNCVVRSLEGKTLNND